MTIEQLQRQLATAADDGAAPPTRVTVTDVYRIGLRRRRTRRWFSFAVVTVAVAGATGGLTAAVAGPAGPDSVAPAAPELAPDIAPEPNAPAGSCRAFATEVGTALESALPREIRWERPELPPDAEAADCGGGGLFWVSFTYDGAQGRLGFDGGTDVAGSDACDPARRPVRCEEIDGGEIGHLDGGDEYGVLLAHGQTFFFLGFAGGGRPLTTDQLAMAARRIAARLDD